MTILNLNGNSDYYNIPNHTVILFELEMQIIGRITDLLELFGWCKEKINSDTPEIIKLWFEEQFDFTLLSISKMEDALNTKIIQITNN